MVGAKFRAAGTACKWVPEHEQLNRYCACVTSDGKPVQVVFRKYDGALHWHMTMPKLGEDEYGVWLGAPAGSTLQRGHEPPMIWPEAYVGLFPRGVWWSAMFNAVPHKVEVYCDVNTVPQWSGDEVTMIDLDLDVRRLRGGRVERLDADEFAEHRVKYGYPADVVSTAEQTSDWLADALSGGAEPFASVYRRYLGMVDGG